MTIRITCTLPMAGKKTDSSFKVSAPASSTVGEWSSSSTGKGVRVRASISLHAPASLFDLNDALSFSRWQRERIDLY